MNISFDEALQALQEQRQTLINELQTCDKAMVDYYHLFELYTLPDDVLLQAHMEFTKTLRNRRKCKNKIVLLQSIEYKIDALNIKNMQKHYTPRVLHDDFKRYGQYIK